MRFSVLILLLFPLAVVAQQDKASPLISTGNDYYKKGDYAKAAAEYTKAMEAAPANTTAKFNQANALYRQDQKVEAVQLYNALGREAKEKSLRAKSYYNKGVILSGQQNTEESIEAYKSALRNDPGDKEARENLQKALLELKKKNPPPDKKQDQKKKQEQQKQQQQQSQSKMSPKETDQRLKLLQQKEKEVQERIQKERSKGGGSQPKDW